MRKSSQASYLSWQLVFRQGHHVLEGETLPGATDDVQICRRKYEDRQWLSARTTVGSSLDWSLRFAGSSSSLP